MNERACFLRACGAGRLATDSPRSIRTVGIPLSTSLREGVDVAVIALWLGHSDIRSTDAYMHADMTIKERALVRTTPPNSQPGRYQPRDKLLAFLEAL